MLAALLPQCYQKMKEVKSQYKQIWESTSKNYMLLERNNVFPRPISSLLPQHPLNPCL